MGSVRRLAVLGALAACTLGAAPDSPASPAPVPATALSASEATALYDAAYDRWRALPIPQYATYASVLTVDVRGRRDRTRAFAIAYRRHDNTCLVVGVPLDERDRADPAQVTNRCLAPDYAFNFVPQYGGSGPLPLDIATPAPEQSGAERTIGHIAARSRAYAITYVGLETLDGVPTQHLALRPLGNPRERILRDLWIDPATKGIVRLHGETTFKGGLVRLGFDAKYAETATTQALVRVSGGAKAQVLLVRVSGGFQYALSDVVYPARLPAWIFEGRNARSAGALLVSDRDAVRAEASGGGGAGSGAQSGALMDIRRLLAFAISFAFLAAPLRAAAAPAPRPFTPDDLQRIVGLSSPQLSPDGTRVALVVTRIDEIEDKYVRELDLVDVRTHAVRVLTVARPELSDPAWSPTGDRLAFVSKDGTTAVDGKEDDAQEQVFVLPMDGGDARPVTKAPAGVEQFAWRPDGRGLAYAAEDLVAKKTGAARFRDSFEVGNNPITARTIPKPAHLWTLDLDGKNVPRELTNDPVRSVAAGEAQSTLSWSPDGASIAFTLAPNAVLNDATRAHVAVVDVATAKLRLPTGGNDFESDPRFSPDGAKLAYLHSTADNQITLTQAYVTSAKAVSAPGDPVTAPFDRAVHEYAWTRDGSSLWFTCDDGTAVSLVRAPLTGAPERIDLGGLAPTSPLDGAIGRDGALAFVGTANAKPSELYYRPASGGTPVQLTTFNAATAALALGTSETVAFTAGNGMRSDAVLRLPPNFDPHRRYPLVLEIHGGPTSASTQTFDRLAQLMIARGWLVLEPNYRGSDDHGLAFQSAVRYDPEAGPGADILAAVAAVRARGIVDDARIAVSGWSYGGIMTAWLATHSTLWHAAVSGASVNDWAVDYSIADDSESDAALFHGTPWVGDARAEYAAASAVNFAQNVTTPILLLSDTGDNRDPIATTYEFYHALRDNGKDVRFVAWPVAGHFPGDPVRTRDVYEHWVDFIAQHLR